MEDLEEGNRHVQLPESSTLGNTSAPLVHWDTNSSPYYLCKFPLHTANGEHRLTTGEIYQRVFVAEKEDPTVEVVLNTVGPQVVTPWHVILRSITKEHDDVESTYFCINDREGFDHGMHGPLTAEEVTKCSSILPKEQRYEKLMRLNVMANVRKIKLGETVRVCRDQVKFTGVLRYKDFLLDTDYTMQAEPDEMCVGIELSRKYAGKGDSDGTWKGQRHFTCRDKCALFVPYYDIMLSDPTPRNPDVAAGSAMANSSIQQSTSNKKQIADAFGDIIEAMTKDPYALLSLEGIESQGDMYSISNLQRLMKRPLPYPVHFEIAMALMNRSLVDEYGRDKHLRNVERFRRLSGVADLRNFAEFRYILIAHPDRCAQFRESVELECDIINIPIQHRDHFQNPNCPTFKTVENSSGCFVRLGESRVDLWMVGLKSEIEAAKLVLEEEYETLDAERKKSKKQTKKPKQSNLGPEEPALRMEEETRPDENPENAPLPAAPSPPYGSGDTRDEVQMAEPMVGPVIEPVIEPLVELEVGDGHEPVEMGPIAFPAGEGPQNRLCVICFAQAPTTAFLPCGHKHTCEECAEAVVQSDTPFCPLCRVPIEMFGRIFD